MTHGSLFSGIGGFDLAAEWMGWKNKFHCEWNPFGQKVLKYYWPEAELFEDITKSDFKKYANKIDILTGGFPCQPYSTAGKRLGKNDERHLWPHMLRAIQEIKPRWIVGENVRGLINWNEGLVFHEVQTDLENEGYKVQPFLIPAASVGAPHRRDRVWFVAYSDNKRGSSGLGQVQEKNGEISKWNNDAESCNSDNKFIANSEFIRLESKMANSKLERQIRFKFSPKWDEWNKISIESGLCDRNDGISTELDSIAFSKWRKETVKAAGNAIVPQVVHQIFKAIQEYENITRNSKGNNPDSL